MNENQGAKGGKQDRKRVFKIKQFYIEKIKELNKNKKFKKKLKKKKLLELQILIPIILKLILSNNKTKKKIVFIKKEDKNNKKEIKENIEKSKIIKPDNNDNINSIKPEQPNKINKPKPKPNTIENIVLITLPIPVALKNDTKKIKVSSNKIIENIHNKIHKEKSIVVQEEFKKKDPQIKREEKNTVHEKEDSIEIIEVLDIDKSKTELKETNKELEKYKASRIVGLYEDKFKEIRLDLKNLSYEYSLIEEKYDHVKEKSDADEILKRLDTLIDKVKELKTKLDIPNSDKYENSYIYQLVEDYISEFNNNKAVSSIKSSELYIDISNKIKELEQEKEYLKQKTIKKKQLLSIDEEKMKEIKKEKEKIEHSNEKIKTFSKEADEELNKINKKIDKTVQLNKEITTQLSKANNVSTNLLLLIGAEMMIPTANSAKKVAVAATTGLYVLNKIFRKDKYQKIINKEISTVDYSKEIEASLSSIDKTIEKLDDNLYEIGKLIYMLQNEYSDYSNNNEFNSLLNNLYNIKKNVEEKRDNLIRIKKEQEKNLNKNNNKVKVLEENM